MGSAQTRKLLKKLDQNFIHLVQCEHSTLKRRARFENSVKLSRMKVFAELFSKSDPKKATIKSGKQHQAIGAFSIESVSPSS